MNSPTYVLVPGAGGMASYWHELSTQLTARGTASVAVALPGPDPDAGLPEYVDEIVRVAEPLDDIVLVGQSLGGFSASWAAERLKPRGLVLLNAMIPVPGETAGQWWEATGSTEARRVNDILAGRDPDAPFDPDVMFLHDVPHEVIAAMGEPQDESEAVFAAVWELEDWPDVPTRVVAATDDRLFPLSFQRDIARTRLGIEVEEVPGGHLCALSHPAELATLLLHAT